MATITARFRNADGSLSPVKTKVTWSVLDSLVKLPLDKDPAHPVWRRAPNALNGLMWGRELPPELLRRSELNKGGREFDQNARRPTGDTAYLMDIVGSRVVTVQARTRYLGEQLTATTRITFGNGPLSVFTKGPSGFLPWAKTNPLQTATLFPAAEYCKGSIPRDKFTGKPNEAWTDTGHTLKGGIFMYAEGSNLPTVRQLQAVSSAGEGGFAGAGQAAGWPDGGYWTGEAYENASRGSSTSCLHAVCISAPYGSMRKAFR